MFCSVHLQRLCQPSALCCPMRRTPVLRHGPAAPWAPTAPPPQQTPPPPLQVPKPIRAWRMNRDCGLRRGDPLCSGLPPVVVTMKVLSMSSCGIFLYFCEETATSGGCLLDCRAFTHAAPPRLPGERWWPCTPKPRYLVDFLLLFVDACSPSGRTGGGSRECQGEDLGHAQGEELSVGSWVSRKELRIEQLLLHWRGAI